VDPRAAELAHPHPHPPLRRCPHAARTLRAARASAAAALLVSRAPLRSERDRHRLKTSPKPKVDKKISAQRGFLQPWTTAVDDGPDSQGLWDADVPTCTRSSMDLLDKGLSIQKRCAICCADDVRLTGDWTWQRLPFQLEAVKIGSKEQGGSRSQDFLRMNPAGCSFPSRPAAGAYRDCSTAWREVPLTAGEAPQAYPRD